MTNNNNKVWQYFHPQLGGWRYYQYLVWIYIMIFFKTYRDSFDEDDHLNKFTDIIIEIYKDIDNRKDIADILYKDIKKSENKPRYLWFKDLVESIFTNILSIIEISLKDNNKSNFNIDKIYINKDNIEVILWFELWFKFKDNIIKTKEKKKDNSNNKSKKTNKSYIYTDTDKYDFEDLNIYIKINKDKYNNNDSEEYLILLQCKISETLTKYNKIKYYNKHFDNNKKFNNIKEKINSSFFILWNNIGVDKTMDKKEKIIDDKYIIKNFCIMKHEQDRWIHKKILYNKEFLKKYRDVLLKSLNIVNINNDNILDSCLKEDLYKNILKVTWWYININNIHIDSKWNLL